MKHGWKKELGSEVALQAEVSQPNPNPNHYRTGRPVVCSERALRSSNQETETRSHNECKNFNLDVDANHYRTGRPVVCSERAPHSSDHNTSQTRSSRDRKSIDLDEETGDYRSGRPVVCSQVERSISDEVDIDFRISGLPHSQPNPNPIHRTGRLLETVQTSRSSAQEIDTRFSLGCESTNLSVER